jgi:exosortase
MNKLPRGLSFGALCGISLLLWFRPLLDTFALATSDDRYTHILLILPLAVALIFQGWRERGSAPEFWPPAAALLIVSLVLAGTTRWGHLGGSSDLGLPIEMVGLVVWWIASFLLCFGLPGLRSFCFPLLFLFGMVPIPRLALAPIEGGLQWGSALAAQLLFLVSRVSVAREGTTLLIPGLAIDVTVECSSIRSSLMLLVTTMVLAYLLLRTPWRRALVVVLALPLSVAKNGLRIFTIGLLGTRVDPGFLTGRLHRQGGIVFFMIALALISLLLWILRRGERAIASPQQLSPGRT